MARTLSTGAVAASGRVAVSGRPSIIASPTAIAGLIFWVRADLGVTLEGGGTNKVITWADQSGQGNDVTQGTSAQRPVFTANALGLRPGLRFSFTGPLSRLNCNLVGPAPYTFFSLHKTTTPNRRVFENTNGAGTAGMYAQVSSSTTYGVENPGVASHTGTQTVNLTAPELWVATQGNGSPPVLWVNNVNKNLPGAGGCNNPGSTATLKIGEAYTGDLYEMGLYNSVLSTSDRVALQQYLTALWFPRVAV